MKFLGVLLAVVVFLGVGGVIYLGVTNIDVQQTAVTKNIEPAGH